jgi:tetratricopeptide (TPR) repeat protein
LSPNFSLALQNLRAGDFEAAAKLFQTAYSEAPADSWARPYGLYYSAEAAFREAKYGQAEEAEKKKSYSVAEQQYSKLTAGFADHRFVPDAMLGRGIALMRLGRFDDAQSVFRSIAASEFPDKVRATARVWAARLLSEKGQHDEAIKALQEVRAAVMQKHPDIGWLAMLFEAYACQGKEDFRKAEELFETVGLNSGQEELQAEAFNSRGRSLLKRGDQREALFSFLRVAVLYQAVTHEYQQALYYAAKTSKEYYGDDKRAKELAETLLLKFPNSYWARKLKAELPASPASGSGGG